ncbi:Expansin [Orobanche gracilis]
MAYSLFTYPAFFSLMFNFCHSFNPKILNVSKSYDQSDSGWGTTRATWYGDPNGAGSDGGSCGFEAAVESAPFSSKITAAAPALYKNGDGCGTCYQVQCTGSSSQYCSGTPVTVTITDSCAGCDHLFDLSGASFSAMANPGQAQQLRNAGIIDIQYKSVPCAYPGINIAFRVDPGSNSNYFAMAVEYEDGHGITGVSLRKSNTNGNWLQMQKSWGAVWMINLPQYYSPPFSFKVTDDTKFVVAENVIPANYVADHTYASTVNF